MAREDPVDVQDLVAMFRRRLTAIVLTVAVCLITAAVLAVGTPALYVSDGTIMIERAEISDDIVRTTMAREIDPNLSIQRVSDAVLTEETLSMLVKEHDLYPELRQLGNNNEARRELRENIGITALTAEDMPLGSEDDKTIAFEVMFYHSDPAKARDVARHLIRLYTEEHYKRRTAVAEGTIRFLDSEAKKLEGTISQIETSLAEFKEQHAGSLPELMDMNLQVMERTERELELVERDIRTQQQNRNVLEAELAQIDPTITVYTEDGRPVQGAAERLKLLEREYIRLSSQYGPEHPDRIRMKREIDQLRQDGLPSMSRQALITEIASKERELNLLHDRYSENHPDIVQAKRVLGELQLQLASTPRESSLSGTLQPSNPEYIAAQVRLESAKNELSALVSRRGELRRKLLALEDQVRLTPQVEREYSELTRDYENAVDKYNEIKNKQSLAQINLSLETEQKGERYSVYKNAGYPSQPIRPNRPLIFIASIALAIAVSVGLVVVMEALDTTMRGRRDVQEIWDAPPLAVVPYVYNPADRASQVMKLGLLVVVLVLWTGGLYSSLQFIY